MDDLLGLIIVVFLFALFTFGPLAIWYFVGKHFENKHYASIKERERKYLNLSIVPSDFLNDETPVAGTGLVTGAVVIGSDPFKRYVGSLVNLIGGRVTVFESMIDRARREAVLRMKEKAAKLGANEIINFRMETMSINGGKTGKPLGIVEVLAYGTAVKYARPQE